MKLFVSLFLLLFSLNAVAAGIKYRTVTEARESVAFTAFCYTRSGSPEVRFNYQHRVSFEGPEADLVLIQPREGIYLRDFVATPTTLGIPPLHWTILPTGPDLTITGQYWSPYNEVIELVIEDDDDGSFDGKFSYKNFTQNISIIRNVRCSLTSESWAP